MDQQGYQDDSESTYKEQKMVNTKSENQHAFLKQTLSTCVTILPIIFLASLGCSTFDAISDQIVYIKFGGVIGNDSDVNKTCTVSLNQTGEDKAQSRATDFRIHSKIGLCLASIIFIPVWGAYSDRFGRHTAVIAACIGPMIYTSCLLAVQLNDNIPLWILIVGDVIHGILGKSANTILVACCAYAADVFEKGKRMLMMILIEMTFMFAAVINQIGGGYWIKAFGFVPLLSTMLSIQFITLTYTHFFFSRSSKLSLSKEQRTMDRWSCNMIKEYFSKTYRTYSIARTGYKRAYILLLLMVVHLMHYASYGVAAIFVIYALGPPLCWNSIMVGIFTGVETFVNGLVPLLVGIIFRNNGTPSWMVFAGLISQILSRMAYGFSRSTLMMLLSCIVGSATYLLTPAVRAIISDEVDESEQGAAMAGYILTTNLAQLLSNVMFNAVYVATISTFPQFFLFLGAAFDVAALCWLAIYGYLRRKEKKKLFITDDTDKLINTEVE